MLIFNDNIRISILWTIYVEIEITMKHVWTRNSFTKNDDFLFFLSTCMCHKNQNLKCLHILIEIFNCSVKLCVLKKLYQRDHWIIDVVGSILIVEHFDRWIWRDDVRTDYVNSGVEIIFRDEINKNPNENVQ